MLLTPYHTEVAAGTMNPATFLRSLGPKPWKTAYLEPVIRPLDGRYGENPMRFQHYFQYQVILKPTPDDVLELYLGSLRAMGLDTRRHDIRFVEDDWEQPTVGAWGLGWEVWCDGMEITQFTYFQQLGGLELDLIPAEITYGLDRLAMVIQGKPTVFDLDWAAGDHVGRRLPRERAPVVALQLRGGAGRHADAPLRRLRGARRGDLVERGLPLPAYDQILKCEPRVQPARRARRDLRHRARRVHRAGPQPRARRRAALPRAQQRGGRMPKLLFEIGCEELPAAACMEAGLQLPELAREHLGAQPLELCVGPRRLAFPVDVPERTADDMGPGAAGGSARPRRRRVRQAAGRRGRRR